MRKCKLDSTSSEQNPLAGFCENVDETLCFIQAGNFLTK